MLVLVLATVLLYLSIQLLAWPPSTILFLWLPAVVGFDYLRYINFNYVRVDVERLA